jgi:serine/threonine protein kinase
MIRSDAMEPPQLVAGKYHIVAEIGRGGMGVVYRAEDATLRRPVALKFLSENLAGDPAARARFLKE